MPQLISFDIDGTLAVGDPAGVITIEMVKKAQALGYWIGSCSDRPPHYQKHLWDRYGVSVDFTVLKHCLEDIKSNFQAEAYYHIGDTHVDEFYAVKAGFHFLWADIAMLRSWGPEIFR